MLMHFLDKDSWSYLFANQGGMKVKADRDESSPYAAMLAAQDVAARCKVSILDLDSVLDHDAAV